MSSYILFRNQKYAEVLANITGAKICNDENKLYGISPQDGDIVIVDAHYTGNMCEMNGIQIIKKMQKYVCKGKDVKFKILSWFPSEWFNTRNVMRLPQERLYSQSNVEFVQLPVADTKLLLF